MQRERTISEQLTLFGARLTLQHPNGELIEADGMEASVIIDRPDPKFPTHSPDFSSITWGGKVYTFKPKQRIIMAVLWKAWEDGNPFVGGSYLLERADSDQSRLSLVFRDSPAWRTLIVPGELHDGPADTYTLAPLKA